MKLVLCHTLCLVLLLCSTQHANAEKRVALVVGNSAYQHTLKLTNPKNDAEAMMTVLKRLDFDVVGGNDLSRSEFEGIIIEFAKKLRLAEVGLFFYAGHGLQVDGENYLVPVDAELNDEAALQFAMVKLNDVLTQMERSAKSNLIFIDACRDNPLARNLARVMGRTRSGSIGRGLAPVRSGIGTMITFATEPGNVAQDGDGKNSPFTAAILEHIETPGLDIDPLLRRVRRDVIRTTHRTQVPWNHSSLTDDFYFKQGQQKKAVRSEPIGSSEVEREWRSLQNSTDVDDLEAFIAQFGEHFPYYGRKASERLENLRPAAGVSVSTQVAPKPAVNKKDEANSIPPLKYELDNYGWGGNFPPPGIPCSAYGLWDRPTVFNGKHRTACGN